MTSPTRAHRPSDLIPAVGQESIAAGTIVAERYEVVELLGRGGMGAVYLGEHLTVGRKVAIKVLSHHWSRNESVARRFRAEARAASAAGHPNIIQVFDAGELPDGRLYLVMEYLAGTNLFDALMQRGPFTIEAACRVVRDVARGVRAAHAVGVIHRDLKPENVMLIAHEDGEIVKVLDFGVAAGAADEGPRMTTPGLVVGTPEYMAPEQATGKPPSPLFDIYALGVMLFELLAGTPPFSGENALEVVTRKTMEDAPSLASKRQDAPAVLVSLVDACMSADPVRRPPSADAFLARLEPLVDAQGEYRRSQPGAEPWSLTAEHAAARRSVQRRAWIWATGAATGVAAVGALLWFDATHPDPTSALTRSQSQSPSVVVAPDSTHSAVMPAEPMRSAASRRASAATRAVAEVPLPTPTHVPNVEADGPAPGLAVSSTTRHGEVRRPRSRSSAPQSKHTKSEAQSKHTKSEAEDVTRSVAATAQPPFHATDECELVRKAAHEARQAADWSGVLRRANNRKCWASEDERRRLRTMALKELHDFEACAEAGKGSRDPEVQAWVTICSKRAGSQ